METRTSERFSKEQKTDNRVNWAALLELLECPVCREYMIAPIRQCIRGHSLCGRCYSMVTSCPVCRSPRALLSSVATQRLPNFVAVPCKYKEKGCPVSRLGVKIRQHESFCRHNVRSCPQYIGPGCKWEGSFTDLLDHCAESHPTSPLNRLQKVTFHRPGQFRQAVETVLLGVAYIEHMLFRLSLTYSRRGDMVYWRCSYYGPHNSTKDFSYEVNLISHRQTGKVFSRQCSPNYEDDTGFQCQYSFRTPLSKLLEHCDDDNKLTFNLKISPLRIFSRTASSKCESTDPSPQKSKEMSNSDTESVLSSRESSEKGGSCDRASTVSPSQLLKKGGNCDTVFAVSPSESPTKVGNCDSGAASSPPEPTEGVTNCDTEPAASPPKSSKGAGNCDTFPPESSEK